MTTTGERTATALKRVTAPAVTPVSLDEVKAQCRVDHTDDDGLLTGLIDAAVSYVDGWNGMLGRCLVSQQWELYYDAFPDDGMRIPLGPVSEIEAVEYRDADSGEWTAWDVSNYDSDVVSPDAWVLPSEEWPTAMDAINAVRVRFTAGYGAAATDVPAAIRQALLMMVAHWYDNRGVAVIGTNNSDLPLAAQSLLAPFRRIGV